VRPPTGAANAMRLARRHPTRGEQDASAFHSMHEAALASRSGRDVRFTPTWETVARPVTSSGEFMSRNLLASEIVQLWGKTVRERHAVERKLASKLRGAREGAKTY